MKGLENGRKGSRKSSQETQQGKGCSGCERGGDCADRETRTEFMGFRWGLCLDFPHLVRKGVRKDGWLVKEERGGSGMWSQFFFSGPIKSQRMRQVLETIIEAGEKGLL